jgi:hypothetical protein
LGRCKIKAKVKTALDETKELALKKGCFLKVCHDCVLLIKNEDLKAYPQPNQRFDNLEDVRDF